MRLGPVAWVRLAMWAIVIGGLVVFFAACANPEPRVAREPGVVIRLEGVDHVRVLDNGTVEVTLTDGMVYEFKARQVYANDQAF